MGWISGLDADPEQCHEGWVAMTYADGKISSGTSCGRGHYLDGYTYLPPDPQSGIGGEIDPAFLRPDDEVTGWVPRCECGWMGVTHALPDSALPGTFRDPSEEQEDLLMGQWRLHLREDVAGDRVRPAGDDGEARCSHGVG